MASTGTTHPMEGEPVPVEKHHQKALIESDPDMANYKMVYMVDPKSRVLILRFPGRPVNQPYCARNHCKPLQVRIKPKHGHVEVDIPIDIHSPHWNKIKAIKYQQAIRKSSTVQKGSSYDMAGGFGAGDDPEPAKRSKKPKDSTDDNTLHEPTMETLLSNIDDANNKGHVMNKITLGGRIQPFDPNKPRVMIGTFRKGVCYMSHVDAIVELSANFQHLDALADLEKTSVRHARSAEKSREKEKEPEAVQAKAVDLTVKSTEPEEGMPESRSKIKELLEDMADEPWQRMDWIDQDDPAAYSRFDEHFGIGKDASVLPELVSTMTPQQWLDTISCPRYDHTTKKFREMTFPRKSNRSMARYGESETVDKDAPRDHEKYVYCDEDPDAFSESDLSDDEEDSEKEGEDPPELDTASEDEDSDRWES